MHAVVRLYRISRWGYKNRIPLLPDIISKIIRIVFACDIKYTCELGANVNLFHNGLGVVIHKNARIGSGTKIYQNVTIGGNGKPQAQNGVPSVGNNVIIGAGAVLLGPIKIGDNATIGANSVVLQDIKPGTTVVGAPAKEIKVKTDGNNYSK